MQMWPDRDAGSGERPLRGELAGAWWAGRADALAQMLAEELELLAVEVCPAPAFVLRELGEKRLHLLPAVGIGREVGRTGIRDCLSRAGHNSAEKKRK